MTLLIAIASHFIADFGLQNEWIGNRKGKSWEIMTYHVLVYCSLFLLLGATIFQLAILFITHFIIDSMKARYHIIKSIWVDQILHVLVLILLFL